MSRGSNEEDVDEEEEEFDHSITCRARLLVGVTTVGATRREEDDVGRLVSAAATVVVAMVAGVAVVVTIEALYQAPSSCPCGDLFGSCPCSCSYSSSSSMADDDPSLTILGECETDRCNIKDGSRV